VLSVSSAVDTLIDNIPAAPGIRSGAEHRNRAFVRPGMFRNNHAVPLVEVRQFADIILMMTDE
jgi:hypothetical protein